MQSDVFVAEVEIKLGHKFKFIIDDGRAYVTSDRYMKKSDQLGNLNNVF